MKRALVASLALAATFACVPQARQGTTFDVFADFGVQTNPGADGFWRYGEVAALGDPLTLYQILDTTSQPGVDTWLNPDAISVAPSVGQNVSGQDIHLDNGVFFPAKDVVHMHPGASGQFSVFRWTAKDTSDCQISGAFRSLREEAPDTTTDVFVLGDGMVLFTDSIESNADVKKFGFTLSVAPGDFVDFAVGFGADESFTADSTGFSATLFCPTASGPSGAASP